MILGLIKHHDGIHFKCHVSGSASSTVPIRATGSFTTYYRTGILLRDQNEGIVLTSTYKEDGLFDIEISIPDLGYSYSRVGESNGDLDAILYGDIYGDESNWAIDSCYVEAYHNGILVDTWTLGTLLSTGKQPSSIPLIGIPGNLGATTDALFPLTDVTPYSSVVDITCSGGYKFVVGGVDEEFPVRVKTGSVPGCSNSAPPMGTISGSSTYSMSVTAGANVVLISGDLTGTTYSSSVYCWACTDRKINRISPYKGILYRGTTPGVKLHQISECSTIVAGGSASHEYTDNVVQIIPERSFWGPGVVDDDPTNFDDCLNDVVYTASVIRGEKIHRTYVGHVLHNENFRADRISIDGADSISGTGYFPYYNSLTKPITRMWDMVMNTHYQHTLFFYDSQVQGIVLRDWVTPYWTQVRQQYDEVNFKRNHIILDCPRSCQTFYENNLGRNYRNLGITRFKKVSASYKSSFAYTSSESSLFSCSGGTLAFGANITATANVGISNIVVDLDTGSWTKNPYQWIRYCNELKVGWNTTNISSISWFLVGVDNFEVAVLASSGVWISIPRGNTISYAGSYALDNGNGIVYDVGTDIEPGGISAVTMTDSERSGAFELLPGNTEYKLRAKITLTGTGLSCTLNYPEFKMNYSDDPIMTWESGQCNNLVFKNGPGTRWGNNDWYAGAFSPSSSPSSGGLGSVRTAPDCLCDINSLIKGQDRSTNLTSDLSSIFDSIEAPTTLDTWFDTFGQHLPLYSYTESHFALGNDYSQVPPLNLCPSKERDSNYDDVGSWILESFSQIQGENYYVTNGSTPMHLTGSSGTLTVNDPGFSLSGWNRTKCEPDITNNEDGSSNFITYNTRKKANVLPWHGYFGIFNPPSSTEDLHGYDVTFSQNHYRLISINSKAYIGHSDNGLTGWVDLPTGLDIDHGSITVNNVGNEFIIVDIAFSGTITRYKSTDGGITLVPTVIATGNKDYPVSIIPENNVEYKYYVSGTGPYDIKGKIYDSQMNVLEPEFTILSSANPLKVVGARSWKVDDGSLRISIMVSDSGTITQYVSSDGKNFS